MKAGKKVVRVLRTINCSNQDTVGSTRHWFTDSYFDLFVWIDEQNGIESFQLSYDKSGNERLLTWNRASGFGHACVDSGEEDWGRQKSSPILAECGPADRSLIDRFGRESTQIDQQIAAFVVEKLRQFGIETSRKTQVALRLDPHDPAR